ncbi:hypothetical protein G4B88_003633 [Cannabis sativa]|uniref:Uncharacterized protein n=1 Tax=Cannabis sativa TaxID=3483 RepID=A0A7J6DKJ9_CANSA|nr:hypothetical protein G4B88_003633 [Cannabis sativa]
MKENIKSQLANNFEYDPRLTYHKGCYFVEVAHNPYTSFQQMLSENHGFQPALVLGSQLSQGLVVSCVDQEGIGNGIDIEPIALVLNLKSTNSILSEKG